MVSDTVATQAGFWLGITGLVVSFVGFGVAWWQLRKTQTAVQAAMEARQAAQSRIAQHDLVKRLDEIARIESDLDEAIAARDPHA